MTITAATCYPYVSSSFFQQQGRSQSLINVNIEYVFDVYVTLICQLFNEVQHKIKHINFSTLQ